MNGLWKHILYPHGWSSGTEGDFRKMAASLEYKMYMWNGKVYETSTGRPNGVEINDGGALVTC